MTYWQLAVNSGPPSLESSSGTPNVTKKERGWRTRPQRLQGWCLLGSQTPLPSLRDDHRLLGNVGRRRWKRQRIRLQMESTVAGKGWEAWLLVRAHFCCSPHIQPWCYECPLTSLANKLWRERPVPSLMFLVGCMKVLQDAATE